MAQRGTGNCGNINIINPPLSKMISDVPTNVCRAQEEKLNDHFSKVSPVPEMNIKIEKIGINEIEFRMF